MVKRTQKNCVRDKCKFLFIHICSGRQVSMCFGMCVFTCLLVRYLFSYVKQCFVSISGVHNFIYRLKKHTHQAQGTQTAQLVGFQMSNCATIALQCENSALAQKAEKQRLTNNKQRPVPLKPYYLSVNERVTTTTTTSTLAYVRRVSIQRQKHSLRCRSDTQSQQQQQQQYLPLYSNSDTQPTLLQ